jgi:hypothetical protein
VRCNAAATCNHWFLKLVACRKLIERKRKEGEKFKQSCLIFRVLCKCSAVCTQALVVTVTMTQ